MNKELEQLKAQALAAQPGSFTIDRDILVGIIDYIGRLEVCGNCSYFEFCIDPTTEETDSFDRVMRCDTWTLQPRFQFPAAEVKPPIKICVTCKSFKDCCKNWPENERGMTCKGWEENSVGCRQAAKGSTGS